MTVTRAAALVSLLAVAACESDAKKLARLESERSTECLLEQAYSEKATAARFPHGITAETIKHRPPMTPQVESLTREWLDHKAKCAIANRDYARLLR